MEDSVKDQCPASETTGKSSAKLLRYPLRSASKLKEEKPPVAYSASASRRARPDSSVSKSVGVLNLSSKEKSAKPPRRLSIPTKSAASPASRSIGSITPISEARSKRSTSSNQGKNDTPLSDVSKASQRRKFSVLSSSSYWLSQIKLSESAAKHSVSLGFFKLALESGCEPLQRMRDELKCYARKHNLSESGESAKELFEKYGILESFEQLQVSETCPQMPDEGTRSSGEGTHSSSSVTNIEKPKPKSSNAAAVPKQVKKVIKETTPMPKIRRSANKNAANLKPAPDAGGCNSQKKTQKPKQECNKNKDDAKKPENKSAKEEDHANPLPVETILEENKENMDTPKVEEINATEV